MASRKNQPPSLQSPKLSISEIDSGVRRLSKRLEALQSLADRAVAYDSTEVRTVEQAIANDVLHIFREPSPQFRDYRYFRIVQQSQIAAPLLMSQRGIDRRPAHQKEFIEEIPNAKTRVQALIDALEEMREDVSVGQPAGAEPDSGVTKALGRKVFVVHGHDQAAKHAVARLLEHQGLEAVILHEQPHAGRTIIEKFEAHASEVAFCVVLLTPDDEGFPRGEPGSSRQRARQNVIFELGFFYAKLGRRGVCTLYTKGVELLSDISGVGYTEMDAAGAWKTELIRELQAAGLPADANRIR